VCGKWDKPDAARWIADPDGEPYVDGISDVKQIDCAVIK
jgi:hypothetical protein